jgi:membrane protease YdiL (CAAX protease family)
MLLEWVILFLLVMIPIVAAVKGKRKKELQLSNKSLFYLKDIIVTVILLAVLFLLKPSVYYPLTFSPIDKGVYIREEVLSSIIPIFFIPFVLAFTPWNNLYPKDIIAAKELFGYPISYLPNTTKEYLLFVCYITVGVFFEELICRQFMFYSLNTTLHVSGDILVVISSLLFAIGHLYQRWKGILSNFVLGLILGKIFLIKGTLAYPIVLHLFLNLTISVLAFRRLKDLRKINYG